MENLEKHILDEIYKNRELWFYNADSMTLEDIEDLMTPLIKTYKHGKNFLIKNNIKLDKFKIYDENENNLNIEDYNFNHEFIPLININGVKFSSPFSENVSANYNFPLFSKLPTNHPPN